MFGRKGRNATCALSSRLSLSPYAPSQFGCKKISREEASAGDFFDELLGYFSRAHQDITFVLEDASQLLRVPKSVVHIAEAAFFDYAPGTVVFFEVADAQRIQTAVLEAVANHPAGRPRASGPGPRNPWPAHSPALRSAGPGTPAPAPPTTREAPASRSHGLFSSRQWRRYCVLE